MAKTDVASWDTNATNNTDIDGINIGEGCPAAGINNALRTMMAQLATWRDGAIAGLLSKAGGTMTGSIAEMGNSSSVKDATGTARGVGYRDIPLRAATSQQTLALTDVGTMISNTTGGIVVPTNATVAFRLGSAITFYNASGSTQTVSGAVGVTLRLSATASTGSRTVAQRGLATIIKVATDEWLVSGSGVS
ncbi:MAG: hypothetical protein V4618_13520 [Pseudomonadota bacterium]